MNRDPKHWLPFAAGLGAVGLLYGRLVTGQALFASDMLSYILGQKQVIRECLQAGCLPLFDPYTLSGTPLLANVTAAALYPANILFLFRDALFGYHLFTFVHYLAAYAAMYTFLRGGWRHLPRWAAATGGFVYAGGGFAWSMADHLYVAILPWIPLTLGALCRAARARAGSRQEWCQTALGGVCGAMAFYCGNLQQAADMLVVGGLLTAALILRTPHGRRVRFGLNALRLAVMALLLAAPQIVPALRQLGSSYRAAGLPLSAAEEISFPFCRLLEFVVPFIYAPFDSFGTLLRPLYAGHYPWSVCIFLGLPTLAGFALRLGTLRRDWWLHAVFLGALFLAFGRYTPVYGWVYRFVPGFSTFRHPEKYLLWVHLVIAVQGAAGLTLAATRRGRHALRRLICGIGLLPAVAICALLILYGRYGGTYAEWIRKSGSQWQPDALATWQFLQLSVSLVVAALCFALFLGRRRNGTAVFCLIAVHLLVLTWTIKWTVPVKTIRQTETAAACISPEIASRYRLYADTTEAQPLPRSVTGDPFVDVHLRSFARLAINTPAAFGLRAMTGFSPVADPDYVTFTDFSRHNPALIMDLCAARILILNGLLSAEGLPPHHVLLAENTTYEYTVLENRLALPRIYTVGRHVPVAPELAVETAFEMAGTRRRSHDAACPPVALVEPNPAWPRNTPTRDDMTPHVAVDSPGYIEVECDGPTWLVIRDWWCPGWHAVLDDREDVEILKADGAFMAVAVPLGRHRVGLRYRPPGLFPGVFLAIGGLFCLVFSGKSAIVKSPSTV